VLVIAGPNTGGKTVALKTAGLLAAMAQSGLHIPVDAGSRLPIFKSIFADIGDEQSISASLSTFSAHITNVAGMAKNLQLPALVLLDEVGAGTDPVEGGALGAAIIDHFRRAGAHLIATTHYDALKSYASTTEGVAGAAFGFNPDTFAPTYRLVYGSQGRSLAIEIAARLGMPAPVIAAARANLSEPEKQLAEHLARLDEDLKRVEEERRAVQRERSKIVETEQRIRAREKSVEAREDRLRRRIDAKLDEQLRDARREIEVVIEGLKAKAAALSERASARLNAGGQIRPAGLSTGDLGETRAEARAALDRIAERVNKGQDSPATAIEEGQARSDAVVASGVRVLVGSLGLEGVVTDVRDDQAEVDVRGKRLRAPVRELRVVGGSVRGAGSAEDGPAGRGTGPAGRPAVHVRVDLQPREGSLGEVNVIGLTVDQALDKLDKFLDQATVGDIGELRIVHGHGTGQLRRAVAKYLRDHPLVERFDAAPDNQGGGGVTVVVLKD
jgi:DNA mismatch repair protein MutS2